MIQPISNLNTNFKGHVNVSMRNNPSKGIDEILSKFPDKESREIFAEEFDSFTKQIEEKTPDDTSFDIRMSYDDWYAGGTLKAGKSISFEIVNVDNVNAEKLLCKSELPILRKNDKLWYNENDFAKNLKSFFNSTCRKATNTFNFRETVENSKRPKQPSRKSLFGEIS